MNREAPCPNCKQKFSIPAGYSATEIVCPHCKTTVPTPQPKTPEQEHWERLEGMARDSSRYLSVISNNVDNMYHLMILGAILSAIGAVVFYFAR